MIFHLSLCYNLYIIIITPRLDSLGVYINDITSLGTKASNDDITTINGKISDLNTSLVNVTGKVNNINNHLHIYTTPNLGEKTNVNITCTNSDQQVFFIFGMNTDKTALFGVISTNSTTSIANAMYGSPFASSITFQYPIISIKLSSYWSHFTILSTGEFTFS